MKILPRNDLKKQEILEKISLKFVMDKKYLENEVNEIIKSFDVDDHVLVRRELINFGYLYRDPYKGEYWIKKYKLTKDELEKIKSRYKKIKKMME